ncbi:dynamin related protein 5A [Artemisia annua]|uniref:Dynamin related protein 5A n=1 Tax=Artemisia annua TaxID=35608 RepID=A0A2U1LX57_ARTAN|nr:dynamin related protein 5A [Artemisia annua]
MIYSICMIRRLTVTTAIIATVFRRATTTSILKFQIKPITTLSVKNDEPESTPEGILSMMKSLASPRHRILVFLQQSSVEWCSSFWLDVIRDIDPTFQRTLIVVSKFDNQLKPDEIKWMNKWRWTSELHYVDALDFRYASGNDNWCASILLGEHVGGSAVISLCSVFKLDKGLFACDDCGTCRECATRLLAHVNLNTWECAARLIGIASSGKINSVRFGPDAKYLLVGYMDRNIQLFGLPKEDGDTES